MSAEDWLEALELPVRPPSLPYLRELFRSFSERIPFESASKIVRDRDVDDPAAKPRRPDLFWGDYLERGSGGTCFSRVAAFDALIRGLGFSSRRMMAQIRFPRSHAALVVPIEGREWIVDVGYPLPEILPFDPAEYETPLGLLRMTAGADAAILDFAGGPEQGRSIRFELGRAPESEFEDAWRRTFVPTSIFLTGVIVRRTEAGRIVRFHQGEVQILDEGSRTRIPLWNERGAKLSEIFGMDRGLLERALQLTGDPDPSLETARIEVFREGEDSEQLLSAVADPAGYGRFAEGLGSVEVRLKGEFAFEARIVPSQGEPALESVRYEPDRKTLTIDRDVGLRHTGFRLETTALGSRLVRFAELPDAREEFLRSDLGRSRIAAILAMDLAALSRL